MLPRIEAKPEESMDGILENREWNKSEGERYLLLESIGVKKTEREAAAEHRVSIERECVRGRWQEQEEAAQVRMYKINKRRF